MSDPGGMRDAADDVAKRLKAVMEENGGGFVVIHVTDLRYMLNRLAMFDLWRRQAKTLHDAAKDLVEDFAP